MTRLALAVMLFFLLTLSAQAEDLATELDGKYCLGNMLMSASGSKGGFALQSAVSYAFHREGEKLMLKSRFERSQEAYRNPPKDRPLKEEGGEHEAQVQGLSLRYTSGTSANYTFFTYDPKAKTLNGSNSRNAKIETKCN